MQNLRNKATWIELIGISILSVLMFQLGYLLIFFLVPLQALYVRKGEVLFLYASGITTAGIFVVKLIQMAAVAGAAFNGMLLLLDMSIPIILIGGLYLVNKEGLYGWNRKLRLLIAAAGAGLLSIPLIIYFGSNEELQQVIQYQFEVLAELLSQGALEGEAAGAVPATAEELMIYIRNIFLSSYLFSYALILAASWAGGTYIGLRSRGYTGRIGLIRNFSVKDTFIWPLLVSWTIVLISRFTDLGFFQYIAFNSGFIFLFFFGIQGLAVLGVLMDRYQISRGLRIALIVMMIILLFLPGVNWAVLIGLPGLGVSEIWVKYRRNEGEVDKDESDTE